MCALQKESLFLPVLWSSCAEVLLAFKARCSGGSSSWRQTPGFGAWCGAQNSHSCGKTSATNYFWVWVEGHPSNGHVSRYNRSTSPIISLWHLHFGCTFFLGRFEPCLLMVIQKLVVILVFVKEGGLWSFCSTILSLTPGIHIWNVYYKFLVCGYQEIYIHICYYSAAKSCATLCDLVDCSTLGFPVLYHLPEFAQSHIHWIFPYGSDGKEFAWIAGDLGLIPGFSQVGMSIESVMLSNLLILCHSLFFLSSIFPSIRVFSNESALCIRWLIYQSLSFSISLSNECSGLVSFRIDWFDLLTVQWTLKSLLQHHSLKNEFFSAQPFLWFNSLICTWLCKKHSFDVWTLLAK